MSDRLIVPGSEAFCRFIEAYYADVHYFIDSKSKSGHDVYRIPSHPHNIAVPRGRKKLASATFDSLLDDVGIDRAAFRQLAGNSAKLKAYCKRRKREAKLKQEQESPDC